MSLLPSLGRVLRALPNLVRLQVPARLDCRSIASYGNPQPHFISFDDEQQSTSKQWGAYLLGAGVVGLGTYGVVKKWRLPATGEDAVVKEVVKAIGIEKTDLSIEARKNRAKDTYSFHTGEIPTLIVYPESTDDVAKIAAICDRHKTSLIPQCSGTSLSGHTLSVNKTTVQCCLKKMNKVIRINEKDAMYKRASHGKDAGPGAALGGMAGTCCSGTNALRFGVMRDWVLRATVVLPNGKVVKLATRARKDVAGYDLIRLFVGSEGTLGEDGSFSYRVFMSRQLPGIITELTVKLEIKPKHEVISFYGFPSAKSACEAVFQVLKAGIQLTGAEFMDSEAVEALKDVNGEVVGDLKQTPTIMLDCCAGSSAQLLEVQNLVEGICKVGGGMKEVERSTIEEGGRAEVKRLWFARKKLLSDAAKKWSDREAWITDVSVFTSQLPTLVEEVLKDLTEHPTIVAPLFGHVGDGNFHAQLFFKPSDFATAKRLNDRMSERAIAMGGTCTGEHGIALGKKKLLEKQLYPEALALMKTIKRAVDPNLILNRGKIFDI